MFTGIVEGTGEVVALQKGAAECRFTLKPNFKLEPVLGESIAVNGTCLTVEAFRGSVFEVYASGETISKTTLGRLVTGSTVNLERALAVGSRLGGHIVSGHVDTLAEVLAVRDVASSRLFRFGFEKEWSRFVVPKGSVTLDGVSLTVNETGPGFLEVNVIPATQGHTTISGWRPGYTVNMETDIIGKYVDHLLGPYASAQTGKGIDMEFLAEHGFV